MDVLCKKIDAVRERYFAAEDAIKRYERIAFKGHHEALVELKTATILLLKAEANPTCEAAILFCEQAESCCCRAHGFVRRSTAAYLQSEVNAFWDRGPSADLLTVALPGWEALFEESEAIKMRWRDAEMGVSDQTAEQAEADICRLQEIRCIVDKVMPSIYDEDYRKMVADWENQVAHNRYIAERKMKAMAVRHAIEAGLFWFSLLLTAIGIVVAVMQEVCAAGAYAAIVIIAIGLIASLFVALAVFCLSPCLPAISRLWHPLRKRASLVLHTCYGT